MSPTRKRLFRAVNSTRLFKLCHGVAAFTAVISDTRSSSLRFQKSASRVQENSPFSITICSTPNARHIATRAARRYQSTMNAMTGKRTRSWEDSGFRKKGAMQKNSKTKKPAVNQANMKMDISQFLCWAIFTTSASRFSCCKETRFRGSFIGRTGSKSPQGNSRTVSDICCALKRKALAQGLKLLQRSGTQILRLPALRSCSSE